MSSTLSQHKLNVLAGKYQKFCNQRPEESSRVCKGLQKTMRGAGWLWQKIVPVALRGWTSDFQQFNHHWQSEFGKPCHNQQISKNSIQDTLVRSRGKKTVLGLLYSPVSFRTTTAFLANLPLQKTSEILFCPLNIEGDTFHKTYEQKVGYYNESVIVLWLGLFNEQIVLGRLRLGENSIWHQINQLASGRAAYEGQIKKKAFGDMTNSIASMNQ